MTATSFNFGYRIESLLVSIVIANVNILLKHLMEAMKTLIKSVKFWRINKFILLFLIFIWSNYSHTTINNNAIYHSYNRQSQNRIFNINRPRDYTYAKLSQHVYNDIKKGDTIDIGNDVIGVDVWEAHQIKKGVNDHFGVIYLNQQKKQLVLAFRGTSTIHSTIEDLQGIILQKLTGLQEVAYEFTKEAIELARKNEMHLSFTGHSLGGFLAELSVYHSHILNYPHTNAVTFESPGSKNFISKKLQSTLSIGEVNIKELDIIGYVSYPNMVNSWDYHVGTLYQLYPVLGNNVWYTKDVHSIDKLVAALELNTVNRTLMLDWPFGEDYKLFVKKYKKTFGKYKIDVESLRRSDGKFDQFYKTHYRFHETHGSPSKLPLLHFPVPIKEWLLRIEQLRNEIIQKKKNDNLLIMHWEKLKIPNEILELLKYYRIESFFNITILDTKSSKMNAEAFREKLSYWYSNNPEKVQKSSEPLINNLNITYHDSVELNSRDTETNHLQLEYLNRNEEERNLIYDTKEDIYSSQINKNILPHVKQNKILIIYALGNIRHEAWIHKFIGHLKISGFEVLNVLENTAQSNTNELLSTITSADKAILLGTKLFLEKYNNKEKKFTEIQLLEFFINSNSLQYNRVFPILLEGTFEESLPFIYHSKIKANFTKNGYFEELLTLTKDLHDVGSNNQILESSFQQLKDNLAAVDNATTAEEQLQYQTMRKLEDSRHKEYIQSNVIKNKQESLNKPLSFLHLNHFNNFIKNSHCKLLGDFPNSFEALYNTDSRSKIFTRYIKKLLKNKYFLAPNKIDTKLVQQRSQINSKEEDLEYKNKLRLIVDESKKELFNKLLEDSKKEPKQKVIAEINQIKKDILNEFLNVPIVWNLPKQEHRFIGMNQFLDELHTKLHPHEKKSDVSTLAVVICSGLGGLGKTQLVLQYAHFPKYHYTLKAWFYAENIEQLKNQYIEFAKKLGYEEKQVSFETALPYIKNWLSKHPGWLLVYDNVNFYDKIKEFLPELGEGSIIITTRQQKWPSVFKKLNINLMNENESIELLQSLMQRKIVDEEKESAKELAKILGYLPLALAQSGAYIQQNLTTIPQYLELYKKYETELLKDKILLKGTDSLPVLVTWNISSEAIISTTKAENQPALALNLLSTCAYMSSEEIPRDMLLAWLKENYPNLISAELELAKLINQLWQYSMISMDHNGNIIVHRLIQTIVRNWHQQNLRTRDPDYPKLTLEWYNKLLKVVDSEFNRKTNVLEDEKRQKSLLPHLHALLNHYRQIWPNASEFSLAPIYIDVGASLFLKGDVKSAKLYYEKALLTLKRHYGENYVDLTNVSDQLGKVYRYLGDAKKAKTLHEHTLKIKERYYSKDYVETANTLEELGKDYRYLGDAKQASLLHEHTLKIKEQYYGKNHAETANTLEELGKDYRYLGDAKQAKIFHELALKIKEQYYGKNHAETANTLEELGKDYRYLGDAKQAKIFHELALKIKEQYYGNDHVEIANILEELGKDYRYLGDAKQAKTFYEHALKIKKQYYGNDHVEIANILEELGKDYRYLGDAKQAKTFYEHALKIKKQYYGNDHVETADTLTNLGGTYIDLNNYEKGKIFLEQALIIKESYYGIDHPKVAETLVELGRCYRCLGNVKQAKDIFERSLGIEEQYYGKEHIKIANILDELGRSSVVLDNAVQGKMYLHQALIIKESYYGIDHPAVADTLFELSKAYKALRDSKQAKIYSILALKIRDKYFGSNHPLTLEIKRFVVK